VLVIYKSGHPFPLAPGSISITNWRQATPKSYRNDRRCECILAAVIRSLRNTHTLNEKATRDSRNHGGRSATRAAV